MKVGEVSSDIYCPLKCGITGEAEENHERF
jgi:hypothetical protein